MPLRSLLAVALAAAGLAVGVTYAAFTSTTSNPASSFAAKRIFPGARTTSAWDVRDVSSGTEANQSGLDALVDGRVRVTTAWATTFAASRYVDFEPASPLPPGLAVSGATFDFDYAKNAGTGNVCFYFEVRRASTDALVAAHGSALLTVDCNATTTIETTSTALPEVTTTDVANDLRIRVYASHGGLSTMKVDRATVTGSTPYAPFTLYTKSFVDAADSTPAPPAAWELHAPDGVVHQSAQNWPNAFSSARYLKLSFPGYLPAGARIASVTLTHRFRSATGGNTCYWFEVLNGAAVMGAHGNATPYCTTTAFATNTVALPEVDTSAEANNLVLKLYVRNDANPSNRRSQHDQATVAVDYSLD